MIIKIVCLRNKYHSLEPIEPRREKTCLSGFPTRSDTNWAVQQQKEIWNQGSIQKGLYYLCSENKGADQLRGYRLICAFVFAYAKSRFAHDAIQNSTVSCGIWTTNSR